MTLFHSKFAVLLRELFHTFHTYIERYGRIELSAGAALPYLPHVPYYIFKHKPVHTHTYARARTRAHAHVFLFINSSMEGMEVWKNVARQRLAGSIPFNFGMEGMEL